MTELPEWMAEGALDYRERALRAEARAEGVKVLEKERDAAEEKLQWLDYHYPEPVALADELFGTKREKCAALSTANVLHEDCQDNRGCPVCGYDCAGANPPVSSCPLRARAGLSTAKESST